MRVKATVWLEAPDDSLTSRMPANGIAELLAYGVLQAWRYKIDSVTVEKTYSDTYPADIGKWEASK